MAQIVEIDRTFSDGDPSVWPAAGGTLKPDDATLYMQKLAMMWMKDRGEFVAGQEIFPSSLNCMGELRESDKYISH